MSHPSPAAGTSAAKKPQQLPWTHQETLNLIQAYQEKWYSLQRGQLKANQWEEVAATVATRCGLLDDYASKTALQCRHKMEKLRRRYRSERQGLGPGSPWPYYDTMEALEHGPLFITGRPLTTIVPSREKHFYPEDGHEARNNHHNDEEEEEEDDEDKEEEEYIFSKSRSINHILRRPTVVNRFSGLLSDGKKRVRPEEDGDGGVAVTGMEEEDKRVGIAVEIRRFAERFERMERKKMEIMHETERFRMQMENKRIEMILDSHKKAVDLISASFGLNKRGNVEEDLGSSKIFQG
ncbi:Sec14p-like phosphatidylinositol transfer family protein [Hibiscus syriacus]|uniref:Sec14p-like phosphatidylinositol transfer family protein n=1 Tax=Hibiscus syriacus TaxID=106335 RepID=A0A6A2Z222_HIBSY|nr:trihelix transcription factor ASIL1-like [Hibiscus syriacus]KAE8685490.1 Sec14p-like phosphatidylinositol transfer family protein [Hibiscus syriacus]